MATESSTAPRSVNETFLVLGGGGMIGLQIAREIARNLNPKRVVVASLLQREVRQATETLKREFPRVHFLGFWGDVFLRSEWNTENRQTRLSRQQLLEDRELRSELFEDLFGDLDRAYRSSQLVSLIQAHRPEVIVDTINTATAISYQDVYTASEVAHTRFSELRLALEEGMQTQKKARTVLSDHHALLEATQQALDSLLISQSTPQLIRHVLLLHRAMCEAGTRVYLKIGTTGTGGMGLNIPYTHSEDKPSARLLTKSAIAFAHTGLLFLMARTPNGPIVKELKPGAMVGYADVGCRTIHKGDRPLALYRPEEVKLGDSISPRESSKRFKRGAKLQMVVVDTGENGLFTRGEFETITHLHQMEFITPEEIAKQTILEIRGSNTGRDVISAVDGAVMNPTYRAGYLRHFALQQLELLEAHTGIDSVALGQLGPPELGKLLWEAHLLKLAYSKLSAVLEAERNAEGIAEDLANLIRSRSDLAETITSIGLPILLPDGRTLLRGPFLKIPEVPDTRSVPCNATDIETWATKGWVDIRPVNMEVWRQRFSTMQREAQALRGRGSAAITSQAYLSNEISIGAVVGWIFNNQMSGHRIK